LRHPRRPPEEVFMILNQLRYCSKKLGSHFWIEYMLYALGEELILDLVQLYTIATQLKMGDSRLNHCLILSKEQKEPGGGIVVTLGS
jgi:hypothetical protein